VIVANHIGLDDDASVCDGTAALGVDHAAADCDLIGQDQPKILPAGFKAAGGQPVRCTRVAGAALRDLNPEIRTDVGAEAIEKEMPLAVRQCREPRFRSENGTLQQAKQVTGLGNRARISQAPPGGAGIEIFGTYDYSIMTVTTGNGPSK